MTAPVKELSGWSGGGSLVLVLGSATYVTICALLYLSPTAQSHLVYAHWFRRPSPRAEYLSDLAGFHLEGWARKITFRSSPTSQINGWHLLPSPARSFSNPGSDVFSSELGAPGAQVVVYFHGNALTRGFINRVERVKLLSAHAGVHVVVIDYRGFGDSTGSPNEEGLIEDALATYNWVVGRLHPGSKKSIVVYGQSLGTGVTAALAEVLVRRKQTEHLAGIIMDSAFTSMPAAAMTHPLGLPFRLIRPLGLHMSRQIRDKWDNLARIGIIAEMDPDLPIMFIHGEEDRKIPKDQGLPLHREATNRRMFKGSARDSSLGLSFVGVPGRGHSSVQSSEVYVSAMVQFLGRVRRLDEECGMMCRVSQSLNARIPATTGSQS